MRKFMRVLITKNEIAWERASVGTWWETRNNKKESRKSRDDKSSQYFNIQFAPTNEAFLIRPKFSSGVNP